MTRFDMARFVSKTQALSSLPGPKGERFRELFRHGTLAVEIYAPVDTDPQTPHTRDEAYVVISGSGTFVTGGSLGGAKPTDLNNVNAGMSQTGTRIGGEARRVKPGDIVIVPAGTPHSFSELDGPIEYLVYRFEPTVRK